jgi:anaphase-promoting complex subunit 10
MSEVSIVEKLDFSDGRELGSDAIFTISSSKPGNGVEQLRDNNLESYWQSDGSFPHWISVQFLKKTTINMVCIYLDYSLDESYTAKKISVCCGTSIHDLIEITNVELNEPIGWVQIPLSDQSFRISNESGDSFQNCLRTHLLQVKILSMHQNGRDTHIRQIKILGPRESPRVMGNHFYDEFKTQEMIQYASIR